MQVHGWMHDEAPPELREPFAPALLAPADTRHVLLRLISGEQIELGSARGREEALELARATTSAVDQAVELGTWPAFGERFVRPGAIVSVDVRRGQ